MIDGQETRRLEELQAQIAEELGLDQDDPRVAEELASRIGEQLKRDEEGS